MSDRLTPQESARLRVICLCHCETVDRHDEVQKVGAGIRWEPGFRRFLYKLMLGTCRYENPVRGGKAA